MSIRRTRVPSPSKSCVHVPPSSVAQQTTASLGTEDIVASCQFPVIQSAKQHQTNPIITKMIFCCEFQYKIPRVLGHDMSECTFIVECLSPIFRAFQNSFPDIKYGWIEKEVVSIKMANNMFEDDISSRKVDLLIQRLSDEH
ncbi:15650_t:CDS:2 [Funneliformis geosporum]|nr:15650_t:CDS:2 [Funneliformis geosporum]